MNLRAGVTLRPGFASMAGMPSDFTTPFLTTLAEDLTHGRTTGRWSIDSRTGR